MAKNKSRAKAAAPRTRKTTAPKARTTEQRLASIEDALRRAETDRAELVLKIAFAIDGIGQQVDKVLELVRDRQVTYSGEVECLSIESHQKPALHGLHFTEIDEITPPSRWERLKQWLRGSTGNAGAPAR